MLDIQFIRDNQDLIVLKSLQKGYKIDVKELTGCDEKIRKLLGEIEQVRAERNRLSENSKGAKPSEEDIEKGKNLRNRISELETELDPLVKKFDELIKKIPNISLDDVPVGESEADNQVAKTVGEPTKLDFEPKSHGRLGEERGFIDKERAAKVSGARFAYVKGNLVLLQFAIIQFVISVLTDPDILKTIIQDNNLEISDKPFTPILPPALVRTDAYEASARLNAAEMTYKLENDDLWLNASAEHTLCNMYMDEILPESSLPLRYIGFSTSFRREAGTYGKDTEGLLRMHQFDKLEMEVFSDQQTGLNEHKFLIAIQEYLMKKLDLPYHVLMKCTADIGKPNARGVDIEAWFPSENKYRETHTADYMTDYQARRLKTRYKTADGQTKLVHTNDATAFALGRTMATIMENYQTKDGRVKIPEVLRKFMFNMDEI
ncbi:MAG TPA: serine--tRNA ligase [Candidatus Saccharimonadales bacterium]|jgi:seryl-tRNA synthetase|nr:serine--tRNA ligase [Candidatus Saccharimonadales bacterium]